MTQKTLTFMMVPVALVLLCLSTNGVLAPTIAAVLGMTPHGSAQGSPLEEVYK